MAFRQPTHAPQRSQPLPLHEPTHEQAPPATTSQQAVQEEDQWILFSSAAGSSTNRTYTATNATRTAGRSRISDFGSLDTAARSYDLDQSIDDGEEEDIAIEDDEEVVGEDAELDSLDSHLHEFREEASVYRRMGETSGTVLPTHDGFGSFRVDRPSGMGADVQEHLYSFEKFNPKRIKRRRESLELGQLELENERAQDAERMRRIDMWRMEQSRLLVDEIQKETRRRKMSASIDRRSVALDKEQEEIATLSTIGSEGDNVVDEENQSFWNRVTRRVIRDLMGIDDDLLSIIFGESLPDDDDLSTTPPAGESVATSLVRAAQYDESTWEHKLLERIARELGILVNQISDHPGAFNTYLKIQQSPLPYAGLPVIPELKDQTQSDLHPSTTTTLDPVFHPTIQPQTRPVSIPHATVTSFHQIDEDATPRQHGITREEWEADLDISLVFSYLRNRFTSKFRSSPAAYNNVSHPIRTTSHLATSSTADTAARAARVRQHHPLVTRETRERDRRKSLERRTWKVSVPDQAGSASGKGRLGLGLGLRERRGSSSCASERERVRSGSSRHYWDFGPNSVGSGSLVGAVGGTGGVMGSWGEV